jgi:lipoprotein-releasing system permease protein
LISPEGQSTPFGTVPRILSYRVAAVFEIGIYDYDKAFVVMPIQDAQTLLLLGDAVGMVELETKDADKVGEILAPLAPKVLNKAVISDWRTMNASLFEALAVDRVVSFVVLSIIILVAAFNILSSLIMLVRAKTRDIAILRTMGASRVGILRIFMTVGTVIGALGTLAGVALGLVFLFFRQNVVNFVQFATGQTLWDPQIRYLTELPAKVDPIEIIGITAMALLFSFLATLYPAYKAANTDPVQVLRYE